MKIGRWGLKNDKSFVFFAASAYTQYHYGRFCSALMFLSTISLSGCPSGTALFGYRLAIKSFGTKGEVGRAIIYYRWRNHEDDAVGAAKLAIQNDITVHVIGMGKPDGAPIPVQGTMSFWKDKEGNVVVSKLNEEMCRSIAAAGKGVYVRADNRNTAFKVITKELDKLAKSDIKTSVFSDYNEQFQSFALLALLILLVDFFMLDRQNKRLSRFKIFDLKEKIIKD